MKEKMEEKIRLREMKQRIKEIKREKLREERE